MPERGAALMISLLVLLILVAIVFQIHISTSTDARVTRNVVNSTALEYAAESALLRVLSELADDAESGAGAGGAPGAGGLGAQAPTLGGAAPAVPGLPGAGGGGSVDSRRDDWARARRTREINDVELRILIQQEDSKYNILTLLTPDPEEADKARDRVVRILDFCREGTEEDIDAADASRMVEVMIEFMRRRRDSAVLDPVLLTDDEEEPDRGLPFSVHDFRALPPFGEMHFRDYRDENGRVVHSIESFLTVYTSIDTHDNLLAQRRERAAQGQTEGTAGLNQSGDTVPEGEQPGGGGNPGQQVQQAQGIGRSDQPELANPGQGGPGGGAQNGAPGVAVNVNLAPRAVLEALCDDREVPRRFWSRVVELRNEEVEKEREDEDEDPVLDEFGEEVVERKIFESISDLAKIDGWDHLEPLAKADVEQLVTVKGDVFSIFLTARVRTGVDRGESLETDPERIREIEEQGDALTLNVRAVVWRTQRDGEWVCVPLERWEVLDYTPYEVLDFPDEKR